MRAGDGGGDGGARELDVVACSSKIASDLIVRAEADNSDVDEEAPHGCTSKNVKCKRARLTKHEYRGALNDAAVIAIAPCSRRRKNARTQLPSTTSVNAVEAHRKCDSASAAPKFIEDCANSIEPTKTSQPWTTEEDDLLLQLVSSRGPCDWETLTAKFCNQRRSAAQLRARWAHYRAGMDLCQALKQSEGSAGLILGARIWLDAESEYETLTKYHRFMCLALH